MIQTNWICIRCCLNRRSRLSAVFRKVMRIETAKQMAITAIALKRYQLKHGNYPPDLNSLVPEFVPDSSARSGGWPAVALPAECRWNISALFRRRKRQGRRRQSVRWNKVSSLQVITGKILMRLTGSGRSRRRRRKFKITTRIRRNNGSVLISTLVGRAYRVPTADRWTRARRTSRPTISQDAK